MEKTDSSTRFQEIINLLISMDGFDAKSSAYSSFIHYLSHSTIYNDNYKATEIFISNIEWAFNKMFTMNDEKSCDRLYLIIIDILLNLKYVKPVTNLENLENSHDVTFNQIYKRVTQRLHLIRLLSQYKYVLRGQDGYGGRFGAYDKLINLLRELYSLCGSYSLDDHPQQGPEITNISDEQDSLVNIVKSSQTVNSIFIMSILSERFSLLRPAVYDKVKTNIHLFLKNPNQNVSSDTPNSNNNSNNVLIPGFVFIALNLLSANYALQYAKEDTIYSNEGNGNNTENQNNQSNDDSFSVDKLKIVIEKLFAAESSPFVWQCGLIFLTRLQTFFKPQKALSLFSPAIVRKVQSLFSESEMSKKLAFELCAHIPIINEGESQENNGLFNRQSQLTTLLASMASVITDFEGEYSEKMVKFANDRKDDPNFKTTISMFPSKNQLYKSAIILGVTMKIINNVDGSGAEFLRRCFYDYFRIMYEPRNETNNKIPSLILQSIPYCAHHGSINEGNVDYICSTILAIICIKYIKNHPIHAEILEYLPNALGSLTNFINHVFRNFVTHISQVSSVHYLEIMCDYLNKKFAQSNLNEGDDVDYKKAYCISVATLLRFILANQPSPQTKTIFFKFIHMFSTKIGLNISVSTNTSNENDVIDIPIMHNSARFISTFIPSNLSCEFLNQSIKLMNDENDLSYAVICAGTPGLTPAQLKVLVEKVHTGLSPELFASFYEGRIAISPSETLKNLYEFTKSSTSGWFKKTPPPEFYHCVIETVTSVLENIKLQEGDMAQLMKILEISLPKNEELLFKVRKPAKRMIFALSVHQDAKPKESFIDHLIGTPMYADSIPGLISKVTVNKSRIRDAIHSWALHTFEDTLARNVNGKFVESIFKYSTDPLTLDVIINVLVDYMGSPSSTNPSSFENDPINAIELALAASEIAQQRNIKYNEYSVDLITRCAEYALSPGDELRTSAIRFLINLFNLNNHFSTSQVSPDNINNNNSLTYFQKQMSPADITAVFMSLFTLIFKIIGEGVCLKIFDKSVSSSNLSLSDVMIIRALLAVHSNTFVELRVQPLLKLCTFKASKLDPIVLSQVEKSILFFANANTSAFTLFMCQIPMNELTTLCINRLMMKERLRNQFINEYAKILSITSHSYYMKGSRKENEIFDLTNTKCGLYQLISIICAADINMECMGRILTCILIWLGLFYFNKMLKISSSSFSSELKTISSIFSHLVKTNGGGSGGFFSWGSSTSTNSSPLMNDQQIQFVINDLDSFVSCLQMAADQILNSIDPPQFDAFIDTSMNAVSTGSDAAIISIGVVFVQLIRRFSFYNSSLSQSFQSKITEVLSKCFNRTSPSAQNEKSSSIYTKGIIPTRILAYALNSSINLQMLNQLSSIHQSHIFKNVLDSCLLVRDRAEFLVKSIFDLTTWLILNVSESVLNSERQLIPEFASRFFNLSDIEYIPRPPNEPPINPNKELVLTVGIIDVLGFMATHGIEFIGKMGKTRLNYVNLLLLMVCSTQRPDIQEKISSVLLKLTSSKNEKEMISKLVQNHMDKADVKALCGNLINMCTTHEGSMADVRTFTDKYLNTLVCVYNDTKSYKDEILPFHTKVFKIFTRVIAVYGGIKEQDLQENQKSIIKLSIDALNQM